MESRTSERNCVICGAQYTPHHDHDWTCSERCFGRLEEHKASEERIRVELERAHRLDAQLDDTESEADKARESMATKAREALAAGIARRFAPSIGDHSPPIETVTAADDIDAAIALLSTIRTLDRMRTADVIVIVDLVRGLLGGVLIGLGADDRGGDVRQVDHISPWAGREDD